MCAMRNLIIYTLLLGITSAQNASVCVSKAVAGTIVKARPDIPLLYEMHIQCSIVNKNASTEVHEFFDQNNNRAAIRQTMGGKTYWAYFDYSNNEFLGIFPKQRLCTVSSLSTSDQRYLFGYNATDLGGRIYTAAGALHFSGQSIVEIYHGHDVVRGINVNAWYSCQYWKGMDATMNVWWFFSDPNSWQTAIGLDTVPVRARVSGFRGANSQGVLPHAFDHIYDFFDFKNVIETPKAFETPSMVTCPGRVLTKSFPTFPKSFSLTIENVDVLREEISFLDESFDTQLKMTRLEYAADVGSRMARFGKNTLVEIHDFNTGVAYVTDTVRGNCTAIPIQGHEGDSVQHGIDVHMKSVSQFFLTVPQGVSYEGTKLVRGISTDTFVARRHDFPPSSPVNSTFEWHFITNSYIRSQTGKTSNGSVPVQLRILFDQIGANFDFNVYNFVAEQPNYLKWDISACYRSLTKKIIQFDIPGSYAKQIEENRELFRYSTLLTLTSYLTVSALRISELQISFLTNVRVSFKLLDVAPIAGDVTAPVKETPINAAVAILTKIISSGHMVILLDWDTLGDTKVVIPISTSLIVSNYVEDSVDPAEFDNVYLYDTFDDVNDDVKDYAEDVTEHKEISPGLVAGVGAGMMVIGIVGGAGLSRLIN